MSSTSNDFLNRKAISLSFRNRMMLGCISAALMATPALAQTAPVGASTSSAEEKISAPVVEEAKEQPTLLGDMWGVRSWLSNDGVTFNASETSEVLGNVSGGTRRGFAYEGLTQMSLKADMDKLLGIEGGTFYVSGLQIHGRNLSAENLGTLQTASGIEAARATRLWELWYDQDFGGETPFDMKIGQQAIDQEFMVSSNALVFVNTMLGWPMVPSADMPSGGPAYPLSALGARVMGKPTNTLTFLAGLYNGSPAKKDGENNSGTVFPLDGGILAIAEAQYSTPSILQGSGHTPLPGTYKVGMWYDTQNFDDQRFDNTGLSLANPGSSGTAAKHHGNYSFYGVVDQTVWQEQADSNGKSLNFFTRLMGTPETDRNSIDFSLNAGLVLHAPFKGRDDDNLGVAVGYANVSESAAALDVDNTTFGTPTNRRTGETFIEATYQYMAMPWWIIQPDFQYNFNTGGGTADANGTRIENSAVVGVRTTINF